MKPLLLFLLLLSCNTFISGQETTEKVNDGDILYSGISYGFNFPGGDLADRYGRNLQFSLFSQHITKSDFFMESILHFCLAIM
jgi:hypothetical protein